MEACEGDQEPEDQQEPGAGKPHGIDGNLKRAAGRSMDTFGYGCGLAGTWVEKVGEVTWLQDS